MTSKRIKAEIGTTVILNGNRVRWGKKAPGSFAKIERLSATRAYLTGVPGVTKPYEDGSGWYLDGAQFQKGRRLPGKFHEKTKTVRYIDIGRDGNVAVFAQATPQQFNIIKKTWDSYGSALSEITAQEKQLKINRETLEQERDQLVDQLLPVERDWLKVG